MHWRFRELARKHKLRQEEAQRRESQPVGPFCYLKQERHSEPFAKRRDGGRLRRQARNFKHQIRNQEECST